MHLVPQGSLSGPSRTKRVRLCFQPWSQVEAVFGGSAPLAGVRKPAVLLSPLNFETVPIGYLCKLAREPA